MAETEADSVTPREKHSVRRIRRVSAHVGAQSYLEIGVNRGKTFLPLDFDVKVAVDPEFKFDVSTHQCDGVEFHSITSDEYFSLHGGQRKFDIIFLDGMHTFQQTFRDFCSSQSCAHDRTVWLIDDVIPSDVYSAWPSQGEAARFRRRDGVPPRGAWHGDVFKVVFAIHDFFPTVSYVTLKGGGNPQTLVWRTPRPGFAPVFSKMEDIERMGYFDLLKREAILNGRPEDEGFEYFFSSFR